MKIPMAEIEFWVDDKERFHEADTGRYLKTPKCCDCGEALSLDDIAASCDWDTTLLHRSIHRRGVHSYGEDDRLLCSACYRSEFGCENCTWSEGERYCTDICSSDELDLADEIYAARDKLATELCRVLGDSEDLEQHKVLNAILREIAGLAVRYGSLAEAGSFEQIVKLAQAHVKREAGR